MSAVNTLQNASNKATVQQPKSGGMSENDLLKLDKIRPEHVLALDKVTDNYLCPPDANVYGIDFTRFKIRDMATGATLFEVSMLTFHAQIDFAELLVDISRSRNLRVTFLPWTRTIRTWGDSCDTSSRQSSSS